GQYFASIVRSGNGKRSVIGSSPISIANPNGTLRFEAVGNQLKLFLNDVLVASATDSTLLSGSVGVAGTTGAQFDNFAVSPVILQAASLPFDDSFNQADGTTLSHTWSEAGSLRVSGGRLWTGGAGTSVATLNTDAVADAAVQALVTLPATGNGHSAGLLLRA